MALRLATSPEINHEELRALYAAAWPNDSVPRFAAVLDRSLLYVCAFLCDRLVGFVNVAWDGDSHAFLLDPTVHPDVQRQGIGTALVQRAIEDAAKREAKWLHVAHLTKLGGFYERCGFRPTSAGVLALSV